MNYRPLSYSFHSIRCLCLKFQVQFFIPKKVLYPSIDTTTRSRAFASQNKVETSWNIMARTQKPDFIFQRNGRAHLNGRGRQFSRLLAAEVCASAVVMLDTPCTEVVWRVLATHSIRHSFTSPTVRHRVPSHFNWSLLTLPILEHKYIVM